MNDIEKKILKKTVEHHKGSLSPAAMINGVAERDERSVHNLIAMGYIEEVNTYINNQTYNFYRATEKGLLFFDKWYKKMWFSIRGDLRNILVSAVTSMVIYFLMKLISQIKWK